MSLADKKVLILTYYWPPSGGSGVQRWVYFAKYLKRLGWEPVVLTVDPLKAAYAPFDISLAQDVEGIRVIKTPTREPLRWYSWLRTGSTHKGIPQGAVPNRGWLAKIAAYIRGNYFIPDARKGWIPYAVNAAKKILSSEKIAHLITTGPPHSTHLAGLALVKSFALSWWVDYRDPWTTLFYNQHLYRSARSKRKDAALEKEVLSSASGIITTLAQGLHDDLKQKGAKGKCIAIPNGYDAELIEHTPAAPSISSFHIVYTGLLTKNQDYAALFVALQKLSDHRPVQFSLAGNISPNIIEEIRHALPQVKVVYHGYLEHPKAIALMKSGDVLLNFIFRGAEHQMISGKLLEYMATGTPILSMGDPNTAVAQLLMQGTAALMVSAKNTQGQIDFLTQCVNNPKKNIYPNVDKWSRQALTHRLINEVLSSA